MSTYNGRRAQTASRPVVLRIKRAVAAYHGEFGVELTREDIAARCKWTKGFLSDIMTLRRRVQLDDVLVLARVLKVRPAWLAFEDGEMRDKRRR